MEIRGQYTYLLMRFDLLSNRSFMRNTYTVPVKLGLSRWKNIFFCEFDGPRSDRTIACTVLADYDSVPDIIGDGA